MLIDHHVGRRPAVQVAPRSPLASECSRLLEHGKLGGGCCAIFHFPRTSRLAMSIIVKTVLLLVVSNVFMTFAWYAHLKELNHRPWLVAALASWGIALFEYLFQVPANRLGHTMLSVGQLKIMQEVITLAVFVPIAVLYLKEPIKLDFLWAALCLCGAVYFVFRGGLGA
jgi:uncharacterized protein (DUF486 family)